MSMIKALLVTAFLALPFTAAHAGSKDIVDTAKSAGQFNTLIKAAQAAGLVSVLKGDGPFTVFAPTDEAFNALPEGTLTELLKPENKEKLANILKFHVVPGKVMASDIKGQKAQVATVEGSKVNVDASSDSVTIEGATVTQTDIAASNGVIHVIDKVILPQSAS
ncbi:MAG: fasciclin domain-containing protein [Pseudomonadota bacterium]